MFWKKKSKPKDSLIETTDEVRGAFRVEPLPSEPIDFQFLGKTARVLDISAGGISIKDDGGVPPIWVNHLASIAESTESLDDKEEDAETKRERLRAEREAKGLGGQVVKLEGAEDTSGFSLMDIFTKDG